MSEPQKKNLLLRILGDNFWSVLILAGILIFGASYFLYFRSEIGKLRAGGEFDLSKYERELQTRSESLNNLKKSVAFLNSINKLDREKIDRLIPGTPDEPSLILALETIVRDSGLVLLSIDTKKGAEPKGSTAKDLKTVDVTLGIGGGDYVGLKAFLESIERNLRLFDIESFAYNPGSSAYSVRLRAYYLE